MSVHKQGQHPQNKSWWDPIEITYCSFLCFLFLYFDKKFHQNHNSCTKITKILVQLLLIASKILKMV